MCRQPARLPIGGEFLMGKLATAALDSSYFCMILKCFRHTEISYSHLHLFSYFTFLSP